jgi:predicted nuclease of predicted toxin-antitoxin system
MPNPGFRILLDQNIPREVGLWLRAQRPGWEISHTSEVGLALQSDAEIFGWAQTHGQMVITYDEDFADARSFPLGAHHGVVRLRVWPTTVEETKAALERFLSQVPESEWPGSLIIIDRGKIRLRRSGLAP